MPSLETSFEHAAQLLELGAERGLGALVPLLGDEDWQTRRAAAAAITLAVSSGEMTDAELDGLLADLIAALGDGAGAGQRAAAISTLESVVALDAIWEPAWRHIAAGIAHASHTVRIGLTGVVGAAGGAAAVALLAPLAADSETNVAAAAITALGRTRAPQALPLLLDHLDGGNDWLRFAAVGALGELGDVRAVGRLELLLEDQLLQEAAAAALSEIAALEAARALARHLHAEDGALRPAVLKALVSVATDERALPRAVADRIYDEARQLFRRTLNEDALAGLLRMMATLDPARARARLIALGWSGDPRAIPVIERALDDPATASAAQAALAALAGEPRALREMLAAGAEQLPPSILAAALSQVESFAAIEAAARLGVEAEEVETGEACRAALAHGRNWLHQRRGRSASDEAAQLLSDLCRHVPKARGELLIELAETLGVLAAGRPEADLGALCDELLAADEETEVLARLALLDQADERVEEVLDQARRAQRHQSARVRIRAIEVEERRAARAGGASFVSRLTDETPGVRRAAARAMRRVSNADVRRELLAALADEDIWVMAETIVTLGVLYGADAEVRARLTESLAAPHPLCRVAAAEALSKLCDEPEEWRLLAQTARRDPFPEVRHAAMLAFAHCPQPRAVLSAGRAALKDAAWPVRRAAIEALAACRERPAARLLADAALHEAAPVRGAALRALAERDAPEAITLACRAIGEADSALIEDAYAALLRLKRTRPDELRAVQHTCVPRAAAIIAFVLSEDESRESVVVHK